MLGIEMIGRAYFPWLIIILGLFSFRILTQLIQYIFDTPYLPAFDNWQGSTLSYPLLLTSQIIIFLGFAYLILRVRKDKFKASLWKSRVCLFLGSLYFIIMAFRLVAGQTILTENNWFNKPLPAFFHMVLATFILTMGFYFLALYKHQNSQLTLGQLQAKFKNIVPVISYPATMLIGLISFHAAQTLGASITISAYGAVAVAAILIAIHEAKFPYREEWKPKFVNVISDLLFMIVVQVGLPIVLSLSLVAWVSAELIQRSMTLNELWPHDLPIIAQLALMIVLAEFPRYWMHRAFHTVTKMWEFHAVHHSPKNLYWLNVGRFHPLEKTAQYLVDSLPFALLGLSPEVLAAYLVFYAINGFYQHSNCNVRFGFLNYVVSGPELHRWHHSKKPTESNNNYGNNLILWDLIFGTWFLPRDKKVGDLGLINRDYPQSFLPQMMSPFANALDRLKK